MSGVFISYRRDDSAGSTGRLFDFLVTAFPGDTVFIDIDGIDAGLDFVEALNDRLSSCEVLLAVIGKHWLASAPDGTRRIDQPGDYVRLEIETALRRNIRVIPLLVDGAQMPPKEALPDSLESLTRRNALEISHARFATDARRLVDVLSPLLSAARRPASGKRKWVLAAGMAALAAVPVAYLLATRTTTPTTMVAARAPVVDEKPDGRPPPVAKKEPQEPKPPEATSAEQRPVEKKPAEAAEPKPAAIPAPTAVLARTDQAQPPAQQRPPQENRPQPSLPQEVRPRWAPGLGGRPFLNVLDSSGLDTDKARIRIAAGPNRSITRKAWCDRRTVYAEFGNFSMIDWHDRPASAGQACLVRTRWKNHRTDDVVTADDSPWPRLLNESLKAMCPETYAQTMRDCAVD